MIANQIFLGISSTAIENENGKNEFRCMPPKEPGVCGTTNSTPLDRLFTLLTYDILMDI